VNKLWLVDGSHAVYRAYHALPPLSNAAGVPTHAALGFTNMLLRAIREHSPTHILVAFDEDAEASRKVLYADYKATREATPDDLKPQFTLVKRVLDALNVARLAFPGYEADDIIATLTKRARARGFDVVILSGDKDLLQLVEAPDASGAGVRSYDSMYEKWYGPEEVKAKWGVYPAQVADVLALMGDKIDNIPGVPGVAEKTAAALLEQFGTLEGVLARAGEVTKPKLKQNLLASFDKVRLGRKLIALFDDLALPVDLDALARGAPHEAQARALFTELEFHRLAKDIPRADPTAPPGHKAVASGPDALLVLDAHLERARLAGRIGLWTLTSAGEPLSDQLIGAAISLAAHGDAPASTLYVPLFGSAGAQGQLAPPANSSGDLFAAAPAASAEVVGMATVGTATDWVPPRQELIARLKPLLEDPAIQKDGHDLKRDLEAWAREGVEVHGVHIDARLGSYLLDPTERDHALIPAALDRLNLTLPDLKALQERTGKGKKATSLEALPVGELGLAAAALGEGARLLALSVEEELQANPELLALYTELEAPILEVLAALELRGIGLDVPKLKTISQELSIQIDALLAEILAMAGGEFSPASNLQLADVLFNRLGLPVIKRGKTGPSVDQEVLETLAEKHPLPMKILEHRQLSKLKSTYLDALPAALGADGRLHTTFDQAVAATGRLSSVNPNLQNIPIRTAQGARIREAFVPRAGWKLLSADYSQIELRVLAHVSGDEVLRASFMSGEDLHARTAGETFGVPASEVTREQRDIAKMINYGIAYGLSAFGLAQRLGMPGKEAAEIIHRYFARYTGVKTWLDKVVEDSRVSGMVTTMFGRRRMIPDLAKKNPAVRNAAERTVVNTPIQGAAADLVKRAMLRVDRALKAGGYQAAMLLQIHDELLLEAPPDEVDAVAALLKHEMESAAALAVPLVVELGTGDTWAAAH
jgi:DNA polymerase-1